MSLCLLKPSFRVYISLCLLLLCIFTFFGCISSYAFTRNVARDNNNNIISSSILSSSSSNIGIGHLSPSLAAASKNSPFVFLEDQEGGETEKEGAGETAAESAAELPEGGEGEEAETAAGETAAETEAERRPPARKGGPPAAAAAGASAAAAEEEEEGFEEEAEEERPIKKKPPPAAAEAPEAAAPEAAAAAAAPALPPAAAAPLGPVPVSEFTPQLGYSDGAELCYSVSCRSVLSGASPSLPIKGCKKSIKCGGCKPGGTPEGKCNEWKPPRQPEVLLRHGAYYGTKRLSRSGSIDLAIKWESESVPLDFSPCLLDVKQATLAGRELRETGNVRAFGFHRMVQLTLAVLRIPEEGAEIGPMPKISFGIKLNEGLGMSRAFSTAARPVVTPACFVPEHRSNVLTLQPQEASFVTGWFSVPKHKTYRLYPRNFTIRLFCQSVAECQLSQLSICARLSCPISSPDIEKEVAMAEEAMKHPVGPMPLAAPGAPAAGAAARGGSLLMQPQLQQQQQPRVQQVQFRGRYGVVPAWMLSSSPPQAGNWKILSVALAAVSFFLFF